MPKCENCRYLGCSSSENGDEWYCKLGMEYTELETVEGCRANGMTLKAMERRNEEYELYRDAFISEFAVEDELKLEDRHLELAKHTVGLDQAKTYKRHGKVFYKAYRNRYADWSEKDPRIIDLLRCDYMVPVDKGMFAMTYYGFLWLESKLKLTIVNKNEIHAPFNHERKYEIVKRAKEVRE